MKDGIFECEYIIPFVLAIKKSCTIKLDKELFESLCINLIEGSKNLLIKSINMLPVNEGKSLVLTGGSSSLYYLKESILEIFPDLNITFDDSPQESVVKGLALYGKCKLSGVQYEKDSIEKCKNTSDRKKSDKSHKGRFSRIRSSCLDFFGKLSNIQLRKKSINKQNNISDSKKSDKSHKLKFSLDLFGKFPSIKFRKKSTEKRKTMSDSNK